MYYMMMMIIAFNAGLGSAFGKFLKFYVQMLFGVVFRRGENTLTHFVSPLAPPPDRRL